MRHLFGALAVAYLLVAGAYLFDWARRPSVAQAAKADKIERACAALKKGETHGLSAHVQASAMAATIEKIARNGFDPQRLEDARSDLLGAIDSRVFELFCK